MKKRLQILKDDVWQYVFCINPVQGIIITNNYKLALESRDLEYFQTKYSNYNFRVVDPRSIEV